MGTRVDIKINGSGKAYEGTPSVEIVPHGKWEIDKVPGKALCRVNVDATVEDGNKLHLDFIPDEAFIYRLLDNWCEAEYKNDEFKFNNPTLNERRPAQLRTKLKFLREQIINKWDEKLGYMTNPRMNL